MNDLKSCGNNLHHCRGSMHNINEVPSIKFRKVESDPSKGFYKYCIDCRAYHKKIRKIRVETAQNILKKTQILCTQCLKQKTSNDFEMSVRYGIPLETCKTCNIRKQELKDQLKRVRLEYKFNTFKKQGSCCNICSKIFLKSPNDTGVIELDTYMQNEKKYVVYNNKIHETCEFLDLFRDELEYRIIEYDHLPENEFKKIYPNDPFCPFRIIVSDTKSVSAFYTEVKKCQQICALCHIRETIRRSNKGNSPQTLLWKKKQTYVNQLKDKGCCICKKIIINLPRFFEMDHIDMNTKDNGIAILVRDGALNFDDFVKECNKCRVLCRFCHLINSRNQEKNINWESRKEDKNICINKTCLGYKKVYYSSSSASSSASFTSSSSSSCFLFFTIGCIFKASKVSFHKLP